MSDLFSRFPSLWTYLFKLVAAWSVFSKLYISQMVEELDHWQNNNSQGNIKVHYLEGKPLSASLCPPQIPRVLIWVWIRVSALTDGLVNLWSLNVFMEGTGIAVMQLLLRLKVAWLSADVTEIFYDFLQLYLLPVTRNNSVVEILDSWLVIINSFHLTICVPLLTSWSNGK